MKKLLIVMCTALLLAGCGPELPPSSTLGAASTPSGSIEPDSTPAPTREPAIDRIRIAFADPIGSEQTINRIGYSSVDADGIALEGILTRDMASWSSEAIFSSIALTGRQTIFAIDLERPQQIETFYEAAPDYPEIVGICNGKYYTLWSERATDGGWRIILYNRQKQERQVLRSGKSLSNPALLCAPSANEQYACWFEEGDGGYALMALDMEDPHLYTVAALDELPKGQLCTFGAYLSYPMTIGGDVGIETVSLTSGERRRFAIKDLDRLPLDALYDGFALYFRTDDGRLYCRLPEGNIKFITHSAGEYAVAPATRQLFYIYSGPDEDSLKLYDSSRDIGVTVQAEGIHPARLADIQVNFWEYMAVIVHDRGKNPPQVYIYRLRFA